MTKDLSTPRPWKQLEMPKTNTTYREIIICNGYTICKLVDNLAPHMTGTVDANAALIVKAVNFFNLSLKAFNDILSSNNIEEAKAYANKMVQLLQDNTNNG